MPQAAKAIAPERAMNGPGNYGLYSAELAAPIAVGAVAEVLAGKPDLEVICRRSAALHQAALASLSWTQEAGRRAD